MIPSLPSLLVLSLLLLSGCGGTVASGAASANGTINGATLGVTTALSAVGSDSKGAAGFIVLTSDAGLCSQLGAAHTGKSQQRIEIYVYTVDSSKTSQAATAIGDYSLDPSAASGLYAEVDYLTEDESCKQASPAASAPRTAPQCRSCLPAASR